MNSEKLISECYATLDAIERRYASIECPLDWQLGSAQQHTEVALTRAVEHVRVISRLLTRLLRAASRESIGGTRWACTQLY